MGKNMGRTRLEDGAADGWGGDEAGTKVSAGRVRSCLWVGSFGSWELGLSN